MPRRLQLLNLVALVVLAGPSAALAAPSRDGGYHIVHPRRAVSAGEQVELKLVPPPPQGARVSWILATPTGPATGLYRAPYVIAPGAAPVEVRAFVSGPGVRMEASTSIDLAPSSVAGAEDCLGPGQSFSAETGNLIPEYTYVDELPEAIQRVEPVYPRGVSKRGIEDAFVVNALVCRSGKVLGAWVTSETVRGVTPTSHDPKLVEAAIAAVKQWVFQPARASGNAVATWVAIPIVFRR